MQENTKELQSLLRQIRQLLNDSDSHSVKVSRLTLTNWACLVERAIYEKPIEAINRAPVTRPASTKDVGRGSPAGSKINGPSKEWLLKMAELEDGKCTSVGGLLCDLGDRLANVLTEEK